MTNEDLLGFVVGIVMLCVAMWLVHNVFRPNHAVEPDYGSYQDGLR